MFLSTSLIWPLENLNGICGCPPASSSLESGLRSSRDLLLTWPHTPRRRREEGGSGGWLRPSHTIPWRRGPPPSLPPLETTQLRENRGTGLRPQEAPKPTDWPRLHPVCQIAFRCDRSPASHPRGSGPQGDICFINAVLTHSNSASRSRVIPKVISTI